MHIIIGLLMAIAGAFFAFRYLVDAAQQGKDAVSDAKGLWRNQKWSKQVNQRLIENLNDPREASAIALYQLASYDGAITEGQKQSIRSEMIEAFQADEQTADELYAFARMAVGQVDDAGNAMRKLMAPIIDMCTEEEKAQFVEMMKRIAAVEGPHSDTQTRFIAEAERRLFPK